MLDTEAIKKIEDFVYLKPRSVQEIAKQIKKSWRTADRYVHEIEKEHGTLTTRIFREGTRGALKIVYWTSIENVHNSTFQEKLAKDIETFKNKEAFSAFDIYQHIDEKNKNASLEQIEEEAKTNLEELRAYLEKVNNQLLVFSGNLSWINLKNTKTDVFKVIEDLIKKKVSIKILCRVDITSKRTIEKLLDLNFKYGAEIIEIRHREQPLRALIIDNKILRLKEVKEPTGRINELDKKIFYVLYTK
ncbi:hypothetical protein HY500_00975 [Candidatus Woesearchaeota archaeon]|nr:hypothetical protein [Candidatus Woesearchaeota archaeon]